MQTLIDTNEFMRRIIWLSRKFRNYRLKFAIWDFDEYDIKIELTKIITDYALYDIENTVSIYDKHHIVLNTDKNEELLFESSAINFNIEPDYIELYKLNDNCLTFFFENPPTDYLENRDDEKLFTEIATALYPNYDSSMYQESMTRKRKYINVDGNYQNKKQKIK